jgi:lambda family phage portal protein
MRTRSGWLDRSIALLSPRWALNRAAARMRFEMSSQFSGAETTRLIKDWLTTSLGATPQKFDLEKLRERSQDLNRNDPVASSVTDTLTVNVIGQGLQPQSRLRADRLGIPEEEAQDLRRQAEGGFDLWQKYADADNRRNFNEDQALAFRKVVEDGEILTNLPRIADPWRVLPRALELIEAERLGSPFGKKGVFQGIEVGEERKEPVKYWIRKANLTSNDYEMPRYEWVGIPARDGQGRPMILHTFLAKRPGQLRGIPFFTPALTYFKHLGDYLSAEVVAAKIAACLAIFITTEDPMLAAQAAASGRKDMATGKDLEFVEPGMIQRLKPGEGINVLKQERGGETFSSFMEGVLRIIGVSQGLPYELLLKNFSKTNYSSARAALLEARRFFMFLRVWFGQVYCQPIWELILEELYLAGLFPARNFYANKDEYCRAQWIGGGWGWVDPVKEVGASITAIHAGLSTHAKEIAAQGEDWEELFEQLVREQQYAKALGLTFEGPKAQIALPEAPVEEELPNAQTE